MGTADVQGELWGARAADWATVQEPTWRPVYERVLATGLSIALALRDEPWGQRRFGLVDPAGMWVDVVEQIEPEAGWWDAYITDTDA